MREFSPEKLDKTKKYESSNFRKSQRKSLEIQGDFYIESPTGEVVGYPELSWYTSLIRHGFNPHVGGFIFNAQEVEYLCTNPDAFEES